MQSGGKVYIYAKPQPLFAKLTNLQTLFAKPLERYFLLFFTNRAMQSLFAKALEMLLGVGLTSYSTSYKYLYNS